MAVKIDNQSSLLGNPLVWLILLCGGIGGIWYYKNRPVEQPVVVADVPPPPPPPVKDDWVEPPPPPVAKPKDPVVDDTPVEPKPVDTPKTPDKPKEPEVAYSVPKTTRVVKPKHGLKKPDALDHAMAALNGTPSKPLEWGKGGGQKHLPKIGEYMARPARDVVVHPTAKEFPGAVPDDAPRVEKVVKIPLSTSRWVFTGVYAPPGEILRVEVGSALVGKASVIVGCHRDNIAASKREATHRFPVISNSFKVTKSNIEVANPFGGLVYIDVPNDPTKAKSNATCRVEVSGGVEAPHFILGETTKEEWMRLRKAPAPWGELGGKSHVGVARAARFRDMSFETAKALAEYWDKVVDLQDWLCGWEPRRSPERMVPDAEISAGSGHSGYPYMGYLDWEGWTDLENIKKNGSWGHYHEIGHNHQSGAWTFQGYGEVTNNVMGLLCEDKMADIKPGSGRGWLGNLDAQLASRLGPPPVESAGGNLAMYVPVINAFGWESLRETWAEYTKKSKRAGLKLDTDEKKKETFVKLWSKHAKANLGPYFEIFGFPYTPAMKTSLSSYKKWMPPNFPPKPDPNAPKPKQIEEHGAEIGDYQTDG